jgi:hypothetical protein
MKSNDHIALAKYLLQSAENVETKRYKKAFVFGNIEPDYNIFTYMRGLFFNKAFHGHNAENSEKHIKKSLKRLNSRGIHSTLDFFRLGALIHYITDSFTFAHNTAFRGNLREHATYERKLHSVFSEILSSHEETCITDIGTLYNPDLVPQFIDCDYIVTVCQAIFNKLMCLQDIAVEVNA